MDLIVKDKKSGARRTITHAAYAAKGPKVYEKIGYIDNSGNEVITSEAVQSPNLNPQPQLRASVRVVAPVVSEPVDNEPVGDQTETAEGFEKSPTEKVEFEGETTTIQSKPERKKPGRKPKSISSSATADEK